ncbi:diaminopimelate decarboxylase [Anaerovorax odorimutans]|uniref:diaminopimelate decarboxylase n=1 Tax=Anaerovorax odorimutans TaxID=109327 RepID=UPI000404B157|nr:diaminopimelate decarboxylase [Anaerovorax odorimutans]
MKNNKNMMYIGGVPCDKLAETCGTPLYIYDENAIEERIKNYTTYFKSDLFDTEIIYASKAFAAKAMFQIVNKYGASLDVVSGGELYLAKESSVPMDRIYFHGNNKTEEELDIAFKYGCKTIVLDNLMECAKLIEKAEEYQKEIHVIIRINPGVNAHTHKYIVTGDPDSKFGVLIEDYEKIVNMIKVISASKYVIFDGFHSHIGSQIFDMEAFHVTVERMIKLIKRLKDEDDIIVRFLNLGGGFGVHYTDNDDPLTIKEISNLLIKKCETEIKKHEIKLDKIMIEPGRSMVAEAGYTLYTIGFNKKTPNKEYIFIDGGMSDNIRVALYQAKYDCDIANKMDEDKTTCYSVAGKCCESGDILIENAMLPKAEEDDLLVVYSTGAYGYSMANNYNKLRRPAVVFAKDGKARIVIKREDYQDMTRYETDEEVNI